MLLLIDNYDSFTYNLVHYLGELGEKVVVKRNDALDVQEAMSLGASSILLSPGPCDPAQAGICLALTEAAAAARVPLMGVCLGHQTIGQAFGGSVVRCHEIVHGKMGKMHHTGQGPLRGLPTTFRGDALPFADCRTRQPAGLFAGERRSWKTERSWGLSTKPCPFMGFNFIPRASPPNMGIIDAKLS